MTMSLIKEDNDLEYQTVSTIMNLVTVTLYVSYIRNKNRI